MAVVKAKSNSLALLEAGKSRTPKRTEKVLDEDEYVEAMGKIIERDFFPDLERFRAHNDYLDAANHGDLDKMRMASERLKKVTRTPGMTSERQPDQTPTPRHPSCPLGRKRARPGDTPQPGETPDHLFASAGDEEHEFEEPRVDSLTHKKNGEPITLNEFAARNTSEDNASFRDIMEVGLEKKRQRYAWLYDKEDKAANAVKQQTTLALTDGSAGNTTSDGDRHPIEMDTWKYTPKNALMYVPDGVEKSAGEKIAQSKEEQPMVVYGNTRLARSIRAHQDQSGVGAVSKASGEAVRREQFAVDGNEVGADRSPAVNGYGFVATPSIAPGVEASPLMTWGTIEGTPFRLDASDLVTEAAPGAPSFQIHDQPRREALGHRLAEKVGQQHRAKKKLALQTASKSLGATTPGSSVRIANRISTLSPAARRLVNSGRVLRGADSSLRSVYSPRVSRTPSSPWQRGSSSGTPRRSVRSSPRKRTPGLTDDLLKLS